MKTPTPSVLTPCAPSGSGGHHEAITMAATTVRPWSTAEI